MSRNAIQIDLNAPAQPLSARAARTLAIGLGTTALMWLLSYLAMLQPGEFVGEAIFILTLVLLVLGGAVATMVDGSPRWSRSLRLGIEIGLVSACINLMLVGSLVDADGASAGVWFGGLFVVSIILGGFGGLLGTVAKRLDVSRVNWVGALAAVCAVITFLMIVSGGIVTGFEAGLAVPDWPNSYGHNMLLYPLSEMVADLSDGIFYEHAHRLTGMFVGLAALTLCVMLWWGDRRSALGWLGTIILLMVIGQGILGGLRVTGTFTMSDNPDLLSPSTALGIVHGVFGQIVLACIVLAAAIASWTWVSGPAPRAVEGAGPARFLAWILVVSLVLQLIIGAIYRHLTSDLEYEPSRTTPLLMGHIAMAALVALLAVVNGIRGWMDDQPIMRRLGLAMLVIVTLQLALGVVATVLVVQVHPDGIIPRSEVVFTSMHQANGALLLCTAVLMAAWTHRLTTAPASRLQSAAVA
ncbi:MAG: COX15/CtaA family protein [Planctomycetota bacterium]|nr:COX15/CtaA family protein [Planctomycetota bacterium]